MKFALYEIRNIENSLVKISKLELPIRTSYRLAKILNSFQKEIEAIELSRMKLIQKYSEEPDSKGNTTVKEEYADQFRKEFSDFLRSETEIDVEIISLDDLSDISIAPADLAGMMKILKEK